MGRGPESGGRSGKPVVRLTRGDVREAVAVLCAAFHDYPVMRYILRDAGARYEERLNRLVSYFTRARIVRDYPVLGIRHEGRIVGVANINPPRPVESAEAMESLRGELGEAIGTAAMDRFDAYAASADPFEPEQPHHYLGMLGVLPEHQGEGHARALLEHLHDLSGRDPESAGVLLTTEVESNLPFYQRFGYRILGEVEVDDLVSWVMFREDVTPG